MESLGGGGAYFGFRTANIVLQGGNKITGLQGLIYNRFLHFMAKAIGRLRSSTLLP